MNAEIDPSVIVTRIGLLFSAAACVVCLRWPEQVMRVSYWWRRDPPKFSIESMRTMRALFMFVAVGAILGFVASLKYPSLFK